MQEDTEKYKFGPYRLDLDDSCIRKNERLHCWRSKIHFLLLKTLIEAEPKIVSFDQFLANVWPGKERTHHNVGEQMRLLKGCINGCADYIKTHPSIGYSFDRAPRRPIFEPGTGIELQAARLYTIAHAEWTRRTTDSVGRALDLFRELVELQPENARAHLGIADCLFLLGHVGFGVFPALQAHPEARLEVTRALRLASDDITKAAALTTSALISMAFDWKFSVAESEFTEALLLDPNYGPAHHWRAHLFLYTMRWTEAIQEIATACSFSLNAPMVLGTSGWLLYFMNRAQEAIGINEETVRLHPEFSAGYVMLGHAYEAAERYQEAIDTFETSFELDPRPTSLAGAAHVYAVWKKRGKAQQTLKRLLSLKTGRVSPYFPALVNAGLGNIDGALSLLEQARNERCDWLIQLTVDPRWKPLHGRARFAKLVKSVGLAPLS